MGVPVAGPLKSIVEDLKDKVSSVLFCGLVWGSGYRAAEKLRSAGYL